MSLVSGSEFLGEVEQVFGGKLHLTVNPVYSSHLSDISVKAYPAMKSVYGTFSANLHTLPPFEPTGNMPEDFKGLVTSLSPHPYEAQDPIHLLADPYCRGMLSEVTELFMKECTTPRVDNPDPFIVNDNFRLEGSDGIIFSQTPDFPSLEDYLYQVIKHAPTYARQLELDNPQRFRFMQEIKDNYIRIPAIYGLIRMERDGRSVHQSSHHPMMHLISQQVQIALAKARMTLPKQTVEEIPIPYPGAFNEVKKEFDEDEFFSNRMFARLLTENPFLGQNVARFATNGKGSETALKYIQDYITFYYEIIARSARRQGQNMLRVADSTIDQYERTLNELNDLAESQGPLEASRAFYDKTQQRTDFESTNSDELRQFWQWQEDQRNHPLFSSNPYGLELYGYLSGPLYYVRELLHEQHDINQFKKKFSI